MLVENYSRAIYSVAYNFFNDRDTAADICQEVFIKLFRNLDKFNDGENFTAWLLAVTRNYCIDHWRKHYKNYEQHQELDEKLLPVKETPEEGALSADNRAYLRRMLLKLDPDLRYILILRDIEELSYAEIARKLQIPEGTVKSRINRARLRLSELMVSRRAE